MASNINQPLPPPQSLPQLSCTKHQDLIKGICLFNGNCNERLLCRACRKSHDNSHLNHYEEFEDLLNGSLVNDLLNSFGGMVKKIDSQALSSSQNIQVLTGQIDALFNKMQNHIIQKLQQSRNLIIDDINKKFKSNTNYRQKILNSMDEVFKTYKMASSSGFKPFYAIENLIQVLRQAIIQKERISNDPEMNSQDAGELTAGYLATVTSGSLFQHVRISFDRICKDIAETFLIRGGDQRISISDNFQSDNFQIDTSGFLNQYGQFGQQEPNQNFFQSNQEAMNLETNNNKAFPEINASLLNYSLNQLNNMTTSTANFGNGNSMGFKNDFSSNQTQNLFKQQSFEPQEKFSPFGRDPNFYRPPSRDPIQAIPLDTSLQIQKTVSIQNRPQPPEKMDFSNQIQPLAFDQEFMTPELVNAQSMLALKAPHNSVVLGASYLSMNQQAINQLVEEDQKNQSNQLFDSNQNQTYFNMQNQLDIVPEDQLNEQLQGQPTPIQGQSYNAEYSVENTTDFIQQENDGQQYQPYEPDQQEQDQGSQEIPINLMQVEDEAAKKKGSLSPKRKQTPLKILEIFKKVNLEFQAPQKDQNREDQELGKQLNQSLMSLSQEGSKPYDPFSAHTKTQKPPAEDPRRKSSPLKENKEKRRPEDNRKKPDLLEYQGTLATHHKEILFGGMTYISLRLQLVTAGSEGKIKVWDLVRRQNLHQVNAHNGEIFRVFYIEEKDMVASSGSDGIVSVWDCQNQYKHVISYKKHTGPVYALEFLTDLNMMASGGEDCNLRMWSIEDGQDVSPLDTVYSKIGSLCYMKKTKRIAIGFDKGSVNIVNITNPSRKLACTLKGHSGYVFNMKYLENQSILITGASDGFIKIWKLSADKGECIREFGQKEKAIRSFTVFPEKDLVITNHEDQFVRIWKYSTGSKLSEKNDKSFGEALIGITNKNKIMTGSQNETKLWGLNS